MRLDALISAHAYMQTERPPEIWEAAADEAPFVQLLGEMISACLDGARIKLSELTLNVSNVTVPAEVGEETEEEGEGAPAGHYVAISVSGPDRREPDAAWLPGKPPNGLLGRLDARLARAGVRYAYVRSLTTKGSITVVLPRK